MHIISTIMSASSLPVSHDSSSLWCGAHCKSQWCKSIEGKLHSDTFAKCPPNPPDHPRNHPRTHTSPAANLSWAAPSLSLHKGRQDICCFTWIKFDKSSYLCFISPCCQSLVIHFRRLIIAGYINVWAENKRQFLPTTTKCTTCNCLLHSVRTKMTLYF